MIASHEIRPEMLLFGFTGTCVLIMVLGQIETFFIRKRGVNYIRLVHGRFLATGEIQFYELPMRVLSSLTA